jgi:anti-sigma factor RsiW
MIELPDRAACRTVDLPGYAAGSLGDADRPRVAAHLATCAGCRTEVAAWQAIAVTARADAESGEPALPPDPVRTIHAVVSRSALAGAPAAPVPGGRRPHRLAHLAALVVAEARLVRPAVPIASALVLALGVAVVIAGAPAGADAGNPAAVMLSLVAPVVAAVGVAGLYRSAWHDPAAELIAATPTSGRLLLLVRLALVLGYDLALALAASAALAVTTAGTATAAGLDILVAAWLGPMALLAALSLLVAVRLGPDVALGTCLGLWALRVLALGDVAGDGWPARLVVAAWSTNAAVLGVSVAIGVCAVVAAGRSGPFAGEPPAGWRATHPV